MQWWKGVGVGSRIQSLITHPQLVCVSESVRGAQHLMLLENNYLSPSYGCVVVVLVISESLWPHEPQHRLPCPSLSPGACSNLHPLSRWCHPTISSSATPFSSCPQSFPVSGLVFFFFSPNESTLHITLAKYWSFSISPSNEYSGLIFFRIDWFDLLAGQGTLKSLIQRHSSKASIFQHSAFLPGRIRLQFMRPRFDSWFRKICWRRDRLPTPVFLGFPGISDSKESTCNAGDLGPILELGRSPEEGKGYPLQYSGLENSTDHVVHGVAKSRTRLNNFHFHFLLFFSLLYGPTSLHDHWKDHSFDYPVAIWWVYLYNVIFSIKL